MKVSVYHSIQNFSGIFGQYFLLYGRVMPIDVFGGATTRERGGVSYYQRCLISGLILACFFRHPRYSYDSMFVGRKSRHIYSWRVNGWAEIPWRVPSQSSKWNMRIEKAILGSMFNLGSVSVRDSLSRKRNKLTDSSRAGDIYHHGNRRGAPLKGRNSPWLPWTINTVGQQALFFYD